MSLWDYDKAREVDQEKTSFDALIMAAMSRADSINLQALQHAFPEIWTELEERYQSPQGLLVGEGVDDENGRWERREDGLWFKRVGEDEYELVRAI